MANETIYGISINTLEGKKISLSDYKGKVLLIVNTATQCGQAPQLIQLEKLYQRYKDRGFFVLGFPSAEFKQEPLEGEAIADYCNLNYGVTFPMFEKMELSGDRANPLFKFFSDKKLNGKIARRPRWNYYKYLIGKNGEILDSFWTYRFPNSPRIRKAIEKALS